MLVVVEGISASGKTSWCAEHAAGHVVAEASPDPPIPDRQLDPQDTAAFWIEQNVERWRLARTLEARTGLAVCDTDPLKLHYSFSLWRIGAVEERYWLFDRDLTRRAVAGGRLGFADLYLINALDPELARQRRHSDRTRSRRNFDLHVRLGPPLLEWYRAVAALLPGRVSWSLPQGLPTVPKRRSRDDLGLFDALIESLA